MSKVSVCDLCGDEMMVDFSDEGYKVKIWRKAHHYDGYAPWVSKTKVDVCGYCMDTVVKTSKLRREGRK